MTQQPHEANRVQVGPVVVDRQTRRLWQDDQPRALGGQAFELLLALLARAGDTVTRAELLASAWPGRVVEHNTLEVHVAALRKVLGADSIVTLRGRGYRLVAPVKAMPTSPDTALNGHGDRDGDNLLLGCDDLVRQVEQALMQARRPLITLVGPGGAGKTKLARHLAYRLSARLEDGAQVVELGQTQGQAPGRSPDADAVMQAALRALLLALGLQGPDPRPPVQRLVDSLADSQRLLVLDGAEAALGALTELLPPLLADCRRLRVLVTSRLPLGLEAELRLDVPGLALPAPSDTDTQALQAPALDLLVRRAAQRGQGLQPGSPDFAAARELCQRLHGLPLALELAAERLTLMSARELLSRLPQSQTLSSSDDKRLQSRHRSLHQVIASSVAMLDADSQALLARLSVLPGGATLDSADAVHPGPDGAAWKGLQELLTHGLVVRQLSSTGSSRFTMHDTVRDFAAQRLRAMDEVAATRRRLAQHLVTWLDAADAGLRSAKRLHWLGVLGEESPNLLAALHTLVVETPDAAAATELVAGLAWWWYFSGQLQEGRRWQDAVLALSTAAPASAPRARLHVGVARLAMYLGAFETAIDHGQRAVQMARTVGSRTVEAEALYQLAIPLQVRSREEAMLTMAQSAALYQSLGDPWGHALAQSYAGIPLALAPGSEALARLQLQAGRQAFAELGDEWGQSTAGHYLGIVALREGRLAEARTFAAEVRSTAQALGDNFRAAGTEHQLSRIEAAAGQLELALAHAVASAALHLRHGRSHHGRALLQWAAALQARCGHDDEALTLHAAATQGPALPPGAALTAEEQAACAASLQTLLARPSALQSEAWARGSTMTLRQAEKFARASLR